MTSDKNIIITANDIAYAEKLLLPSSEQFDQIERIPIIKDFSSSFDVNACPGSGKTTVLVAKLLLLASKLPLANGKGVCILTHTNVAIDEIKAKLGDRSEILFKYPNYVGTIQGFVDRFLAQPFYRQVTGESLYYIDDDIYRHQLAHLYQTYSTLPDLKWLLSYLAENEYGNYRVGKEKENFITYIDNCRLKIIDGNINIFSKDGRNLNNKRYHSDLCKIMYNQLFRKGVIKYQEAFELANTYLNRHPEVKLAFSNRFKYVFIDEMQDTKEYQNIILEKIFSYDSCIIQRFGDINQDIGSMMNEEGHKCGWDFNGVVPIKTINSSKRYGRNIAKFLSPLRVLPEGNLAGDTHKNSLTPIILVFNNACITNVIPTFQELLTKHDIPISHAKVVGAIGIKGNAGEITLCSYASHYTKSNRRTNLHIKFAERIMHHKSFTDLWNIIEKIINTILDDHNVPISLDALKKLSPNDYSKQVAEIRKFIPEWSNLITNSFDSAIQTIQEHICAFVSTYYIEGITIDTVKQFLCCSEATETPPIQQTTGSNIEVNTIHGVKGETHTATLYVETRIQAFPSGQINDMRDILDYLCNPSTIVSDQLKHSLALAYVAMSRPTQLLCIGVSIETLAPHIKQLKTFGYTIEACSEEIDVLMSQDISTIAT